MTATPAQFAFGPPALTSAAKIAAPTSPRSRSAQDRVNRLRSSSPAGMPTQLPSLLPFASSASRPHSGEVLLNGGWSGRYNSQDRPDGLHSAYHENLAVAAGAK